MEYHLKRKRGRRILRSYLEVLLFEQKWCSELASLLREVDLDKSVSLFPSGLPKDSIRFPYNYESLLLKRHTEYIYGIF